MHIKHLGGHAARAAAALSGIERKTEQRAPLQRRGCLVAAPAGTRGTGRLGAAPRERALRAMTAG
jgi:hypothetical protein